MPGSNQECQGMGRIYRSDLYRPARPPRRYVDRERRKGVHGGPSIQLGGCRGGEISMKDWVSFPASPWAPSTQSRTRLTRSCISSLPFLAMLRTQVMQMLIQSTLSSKQTKSLRYFHSNFLFVITFCIRNREKTHTHTPTQTRAPTHRDSNTS